MKNVNIKGPINDFKRNVSTFFHLMLSFEGQKYLIFIKKYLIVITIFNKAQTEELPACELAAFRILYTKQMFEIGNLRIPE